MRTHLLQIAGRLLLPLVLVGCQETSTAPQREEAAGQSADGATMSPAISARAGGAADSHFVAKGASGGVSWFTEPDASGNVVTGFLQVSRGGTPSNPELFLLYEVSRVDAVGNFTDLEAGAGLIPAGDVQVSGPVRLKLTTNTSTDPNFSVSAGAGGLVSVQWDRNPRFQVRFTGHSEVKAGNLTEHINGTSTTSSATATGNVVGFPITPSQTAQIGSSHNVTIDIFH